MYIYCNVLLIYAPIVMGIRWPYVVLTEFLNDRCEAESIGCTLRRLRWNLFGHIRRLNAKTPAQIVMHE